MLLVVEKLFAGDTVSCMWSSRRAVYGFTRLLPQRGMQKMSKNKLIDLNNITVSFDGETVLDNLSLSIEDGEFVTLLGASGCGKTTTLRIIAGFIEPDSGDVFFDGKRINGVPPYKRHINTIFQRYALFPNYNVYDNVAFGLRVSKVPEPEIKEIKDTLASLRLDSVISAGFRIGRSAASDYVTAGKAAIDGLPCEKPDRIVTEGATISVRGLGKIKLTTVNGQTKKGRISVVIHRYV